MENDCKKIFQLALGLKSPWEIKSVILKEQQGSGVKFLYIDIGWVKNHPFKTEIVPDKHTSVWRHLNFFEHECYINCNLPRIKEDVDAGTIEVPWANKENGLVLPFEGLKHSHNKSEMVVEKFPGFYEYLKWTKN